jgi:hypothetical protein
MKWIQEDGYITTGGPLRASVKYHKSFNNYQVRVGGLSAHWAADTEEEAKRFGEEQLQIMKRAFILSLITKFSDDLYVLGIGVMQIVGGYDGDKWKVYQNSDQEMFQGNLEECKNYIASCF